jgi:hypothetical protein
LKRQLRSEPGSADDGLLDRCLGVGEAMGLGAGPDDRAAEGEPVDESSAGPGSVNVFVPGHHGLGVLADQVVGVQQHPQLAQC